MLEKLGFTHSESIVYEALIMNGSQTIYQLIKHTHTHTSVLYTTIQRLMNKGFVTYVQKGHARVFSAANPETLLAYNREITAELQHQVEEWKKIKLLQKQTVVEVFEGLSGLTNLFNSLLSNAKPHELYLSFTLGQEFWNEKCLHWFNNLGRKRIALKLNVKSLCSLKNKPLFDKVGDWKILKKVGLRFSEFEFPQGIVIFRDSIIFLSWNPIKAIKIEDSAMAKHYNRFFLYVYNQSTPLLNKVNDHKS